MPALEVITIVFLSAIGSFIGEQVVAQTIVGDYRPQPKTVHALRVVPSSHVVSYKGNWTNAGRIN